MTQQTASYIFEFDIHNFTTPPDRKNQSPHCYCHFQDFSDSSDDFKAVEFGSKTFELNLGKNTTKWQFSTRACDDRLFIHLTKKDSDFNHFTARATLLIAFDDEKPYFFDYVIGKSGKLDSFDLPYDKMIGKRLNCNQKSTLKIFIELELIEGKFPYNQISYVSSMSPKIEKLYISKDYSDFTIVCSDGVELNAHRCILSVNSPVLKAMIDIGMQESVENRMKVPDIDGVVMDKILRFMYSHKVDDISDHIEGLLYGAEKYQMNDLKGMCISNMFTSLSFENAVKYFMLAHFYEIEHLMQLSLVYIQFYHEELRKTDEWDELTIEQLELIQQHVIAFEERSVLKYNMSDKFWEYNFYH